MVYDMVKSLLTNQHQSWSHAGICSQQGLGAGEWVGKQGCKLVKGRKEAQTEALSCARPQAAASFAGGSGRFKGTKKHRPRYTR